MFDVFRLADVAHIFIMAFRLTNIYFVSEKATDRGRVTACIHLPPQSRCWLYLRKDPRGRVEVSL